MHKVGEMLSAVGNDGPVLTLQPGGNFGDELIYRGFEKVSDRAGIRCEPFDRGRNRSDAPPVLPSASVLVYLDSARESRRSRRA